MNAIKKELQDLLKKYRETKAEEDRIDKLLQADPENEKLEAEWNDAFTAYLNVYCDLGLALANFTGGRLSPAECKGLLIRKFDHVAALIDALE